MAFYSFKDCQNARLTAQGYRPVAPSWESVLYVFADARESEFYKVVNQMK